MKRYHVNPKTGAFGECKAKVKCRFTKTSINENHYSSKKEAIQASEEILKKQHSNVLQSTKKTNLKEIHRTDFVKNNSLSLESRRTLRKLHNLSEVNYIENFNKYSPKKTTNESTVDILGD